MTQQPGAPPAQSPEVNPSCDLCGLQFQSYYRLLQHKPGVSKACKRNQRRNARASKRLEQQARKDEKIEHQARKVPKRGPSAMSKGSKASGLKARCDAADTAGMHKSCMLPLASSAFRALPASKRASVWQKKGRWPLGGYFDMQSAYL